MVLQTKRHKHRQKHWSSVFLDTLVYLPWQPSRMLQSLGWRPSFSAISLTSNTNSMTISDTYIMMVPIYLVTNVASIIQITILRWRCMHNFKHVLLVWNKCLTCLCCNVNLLNPTGLNISYDLSRNNTTFMTNHVNIITMYVPYFKVKNSHCSQCYHHWKIPKDVTHT
jgi:hypothetical protein